MMSRHGISNVFHLYYFDAMIPYIKAVIKNQVFKWISIV